MPTKNALHSLGTVGWEGERDMVGGEKCYQFVFSKAEVGVRLSYFLIKSLIAVRVALNKIFKKNVFSTNNTYVPLR